MSAAGHPATGDRPIDPRDVMAVEFYLRCRIGSPLKSWFSPKAVAPTVGLTAQQTGSVMATLASDPPEGLTFDRRPGGRGGAKWCVTRTDSELPGRSWWIEHGERLGGEPVVA